MNLPDSFSNEKLEIHDGAKKIFRTATDLVRRLDRIGKHATICDELFTSEAKVLRIRLREQCERLMFCDPLGHGKKAEELLWRKVYYEVISIGKQLRKDGDDISRLCDHINAGSGAYHHLLFRIQTEFDLKGGASDFLSSSSSNYKKFRFEDKLSSEWKQNSDKNEWAMSAFHRGLICLGDLARYRQDLFENAGPDVSSRFYSQAAAFLPSAGMPHNQLGTLAGGKNFGCDAAYHYMRCLYSAQSFEGSKGNLERIFNKANRLITSNAHLSAKENSIKRCIGRFLKFCEFCCMEEKKNSSVQLERVCQEILADFYVWLSNDTILDTLDDQLIFRVVVMAIMCTNHVSNGGSRNQSAAIAFSLALFSHLLHFIVLRLQSVSSQSNNGNSPKHNGDTKQKSHVHMKRLRRPRRAPGSTSGVEDSDLSEADDHTDEESDETTTDMSEIEEDNTSQDSDDIVDDVVNDVEKPFVNGNEQESKMNGEKSKCRPSKVRLVKTPRDEFSKCLSSLETLIMCLKLCSDWLGGQSEILEMCAQGCHLLCTRLVSFLNLVSPVLSWQMKDGVFDSDFICGLKMCKQGQEWHCSRPLPEDVAVSGIALFSNVNKELNFDSAHRVWINSQETMALRISCLHQFGLILARSDTTGLSFNPISGEFHYKTETNHKTTETDHKNDFDVQKKKVMENMAHLWLKAEVTELETTVESSCVRRLSPYLVVTWGVLIDHLTVLRHLVASRRFIVVIPSVVISHLDWIKKESIQARDAIRWLEAEFHRGNRYLRAQKSHEHTSLSPIKYPKRKEKEAWNLFQIFECCKHLSEQNSSTVNGGLVTLLTGNTEQWATVNARFLADSTGINSETIDVFVGKWQNTDAKNGAGASTNNRDHSK